MIRKFKKKKQIIVDVLTWTGENQDEVYEFLGNLDKFYISNGIVTLNFPGGKSVVEIGDLIIKNEYNQIFVSGEEEFGLMYEEITE